MALVLSLGSNLGNKVQNLEKARKYINYFYKIISESPLYLSTPQEYTKQPFFINQVIICEQPKTFTPQRVLRIFKRIERCMGVNKKIFKGPRKIDIDILFWGTIAYRTNNLSIPHLSWYKRQFVLYPLGNILENHHYDLKIFSIKNKIKKERKRKNDSWFIKNSY